MASTSGSAGSEGTNVDCEFIRRLHGSAVKRGRSLLQPQSPNSENEGKKKKTANLSIGFHRKELTLRIPMPAKTRNEILANRSEATAAAGPSERIRSFLSAPVINICSPGIRNAFKLYVSVDSASLPTVRNRETSRSLSASVIRDYLDGNHSTVAITPAHAAAAAAAVATVEAVAARGRGGAHQASRIPDFRLQEDIPIHPDGEGEVRINIQPERMPSNGALFVIPDPPGFCRQVRKPLKTENTRNNTESQIRQVFQDLNIEVTHIPNAQEVGIRLYQRTDVEQPGNAIPVNAGGSDKNDGIHWKDFKFVLIQLQFFKPDESDGAVGKRVNVSRIFEVTAKSPCGMDLCPCNNNGSFMCFRGVLCQFSDLQPYFVQTLMVSAHGQLKMPVLNILLSATFYCDEEKDLKTILSELRAKSQTDMGKKVLEQGLHADFSIRVEGQSYPCHKSILSAHSDVFAAMFAVPMAENESNELNMDDLSCKGVEALLKFMYHGEIESAVVSSSIAFELLKAGHKYQIESLEKIAKELLHLESVFKFELPTALNLFTFCGQVDGLVSLQDKAVRVLKARSDELIDSEDYEELLTFNPQVAKELFRRICRV